MSLFESINCICCGKPIMLLDSNLDDYIEHAKKLLQNNTEVSMETLSVDSGFGSLSSFTRAFKSIEGISPRAYKDKLDKGMS